MMASLAPASNNFLSVGTLSRILFSLAIRFSALIGELMSTLSRTVLPLKSNSLRAFILAMDRLSSRLCCSAEGLPIRQPEVPVRRSDRLQTIRFHAHRGANTVDRFRNRHRLLGNVESEHDLASGLHKGVFPDHDLIEIGPRASEVSCIFEDGRISEESFGDRHHADAVVGRHEFDGVIDR